MANKLTLTDIDNILDNHIETSIDFLMVVDHGLAFYISEYLGETYDLIDETNDLSPYTKEYYISMLFDDEEIQMFCETARANDGDYKYSDFFDSYGDYYIFTDMDRETVDKTLVGNASWSFCELVEDKDDSNDSNDSQYDVSSECSNCDGCDEHCGRENHNEEYIDDSEDDICSECGETDCVCDYEECQCDDCRSQRHDDIVNASVGKAFEKIMASEGCPNCIVDALFQMSLEMKRLGWSDRGDFEEENRESEESNKTINIHIGNIQFPNVTDNINDFISGIKDYAIKYSKQ